VSDFAAAHSALARALEARGYTTATPVQKAVIDPETEGRDLLVSAQTGSGKTIAFGLAMADTLLEGAEHFRPAGEPLALIIAPTRELALQVQRELGWLYQQAGARIVSCVGGMDPGAERRELSRGAHIVVGTPGRLRDHLERRVLNLTALKCAVLDEADEMLDMGFREDLQFILETTPVERRTLLFSATLPKAIVTLASHYQKDALRIATKSDVSGHADIEYRAIRIAGNKIERGVVNLLRFIDPPGALVFCGTRERVRHMAAQLTERGFAAVALSGEMSQSERNHALQALRDGRARVCVATDVAARGIDLPNLALVIHADLPNDAAVMQHRSGRTGRAGKKGISVLLVPPSRRRRVEEMLGKARVTANWGEAPSAAAIRKLDQERLLENPLLMGGEGAPNDDDFAMAEALLKSSDARTIAAAFVKMYRAGLPAPEEIEDEPFQRDKPREFKDRGERKPRGDFERGPREDRGPRDHAPRERAPRAPREGDMQNGVWFRLNVGRGRNADPKWLLPEICRQGELTKKDIGAIRIFETESLFQVSAEAAPKFATMIGERKKGGVKISPALDQTGETTFRQRDEAPHEPHAPRERLTDSDTPGDAPPRKPGFKKKFGDKKKFGGGKKFGKPGGFKGKKPHKPKA